MTISLDLYIVKFTTYKSREMVISLDLQVVCTQIQGNEAGDWQISGYPEHYNLFFYLLQCLFSMLPIMKAKQRQCVNLELDLKVPLRMLLRPHLLDLYEFFRICGQDTKVNLVFIKLYDQIKHLSTKGVSKVSENLFMTL